MEPLVHKEKAPRSSDVEDVSESRMKATAWAAKTVEGLANGMIEVGEVTPIVVPLLVALKLARDTFDEVNRHRKQLEELHDQCMVITTHVFNRCDAQSSNIDIAPLVKCVADLMVLATSYSVGATIAKAARYRDDDRIDGLRRDIEALVPIMGLGGVVKVSGQLESIQSNNERKADAIKVASTEHKALLVSGCGGSYMRDGHCVP